jgi:hypothetical protein
VSGTFFEDAKAEDVAWQLCVFDARLFARIEADELRMKRFTQHDVSPNYHAMLRHVNNIGLWVGTRICSEAQMERRVAALVKLIGIAHHSVALHNFNAAFSIVAALNGVAVSRLDATWERVPKNAMKQCLQLYELFDVKSNAATYRAHLDNAQGNVVPYIAIITKDLFSIEEAMPLREENHPRLRSSLINVGKLRSIHRHIARVKHWQSRTNYDIKPIAEYQLYFHTLNVLTEEQIYALSIQIEPRK